VVTEHGGIEGVHLEHGALELAVYLVERVDLVQIRVDYQEADLQLRRFRQ